MRYVEQFVRLGGMVATLSVDLFRLLGASVRPRTAVAVESLLS